MTSVFVFRLFAFFYNVLRIYFSISSFFVFYTVLCIVAFIFICSFKILFFSVKKNHSVCNIIRFDRIDMREYIQLS